MRLLESLARLFNDLRAQKLRTALTILGITWGTVAVVVLLAFGVGMERQMKKQARGIGDGIVIVFPGRTTKAFQGFGEGRPIRLRHDDIEAIAREVPGVELISPEYGRRVPSRLGTATTNAFITGMEPAYGEMRNIIVEPGGRFINRPDVEERRRVAVLGDGVKDLLFGEEDAIGKSFFIGDVPFTVVGVMQEKAQNSSYNARDKDRIFIPASTFRAIFGAEYINNFIYRPTDPAIAPAVEKRIYEVLGRRHVFDPTDKDVLGIWDTAVMMKFFNTIFFGFNLFLGVVGSFTLTVGGIGVANIMYIVVRERTREIGIKRSLGARKRDILFQFIFETLVIVATGATMGLLLSYGIVGLAGSLPGQDFIGTPTISTTVLTTTISLLAAIALLAGFFPARRAANLDPVECLRS